MLYLLMLIAFAAGFSDIGGSFDFFGAGYFGSYPLSLPVDALGEPVFDAGAAFCAARLIYFAAGVVLFVISISISRKKPWKEVSYQMKRLQRI